SAGERVSDAWFSSVPQILGAVLVPPFCLRDRSKAAPRRRRKIHPLFHAGASDIRLQSPLLVPRNRSRHTASRCTTCRRSYRREPAHRSLRAARNELLNEIGRASCRERV